jgi:hypothetical protein
MAEESTNLGASGLPYRIEFRRSHTHQHLNADGVWVGSNGFGRIILNFYNDSPPLPTTITAETTADGKIFTSKAPVMTFEASGGAIRVFDTSVGLSLPTVKELVVTLQNFIKLVEETQKSKTE